MVRIRVAVVHSGKRVGGTFGLPMLDTHMCIEVITSSVDARTVRTGICSRHMDKTMFPATDKLSAQFTPF